MRCLLGVKTMHMFWSLSALFLLVLGGTADDVTDGTELVLAFLTNRHGDRTPIESTLSLSTDPDELEARSQRYGYGQLTDEGKRTAFNLGGFLRERYGGLLSAQYNRSELYVRCTDSTRAKMTALAALAALYPTADDNWSSTINWQPVPYTTVPIKYDSNLASLNCPTLITFSSSVSAASSLPELEPYSALLDRWSALVGYNISAMPILASSYYDVYKSQMSLGIPLTEELEEIFPEMAKAAGAAYQALLGNDDYIALQAGVLLQEFFTVVELATAGSATPAVRILSAHDYNVFSLMAVARVHPTLVPAYGSMFALELRRVTDTGDYVVLPVYRVPGSAAQYMPVTGCSALLCTLEEFATLTAPYLLDETTWRTDCAFTDDIVIDDSSVA